ncbi:MAG: DUF2147 domain-containing protein [Bacteroidota bacterium]
MKKISSLRVLILLTFIGSLLAFTIPQDEAKSQNKIVGLWEVGSGKARVKIVPYGEKFAGRIVWLKEPTYPDGTVKVDKNNQDETKRSVPLLGYTNLIGFVDKGKGKYEEGTIYDPENGNTYNCTITLTDDNTLEVRGYIGVSLFGRTDIWKKVALKK